MEPRGGGAPLGIGGRPGVFGARHRRGRSAGNQAGGGVPAHPAGQIGGQGIGKAAAAAVSLGQVKGCNGHILHPLLLRHAGGKGRAGIRRHRNMKLQLRRGIVGVGSRPGVLGAGLRCGGCAGHPVVGGIPADAVGQIRGQGISETAAAAGGFGQGEGGDGGVLRPGLVVNTRRAERRAGGLRRGRRRRGRADLAGIVISVGKGQDDGCHRAVAGAVPHLRVGIADDGAFGAHGDGVVHIAVIAGIILPGYGYPGGLVPVSHQPGGGIGNLIVGGLENDMRVLDGAVAGVVGDVPDDFGIALAGVGARELHQHKMVGLGRQPHGKGGGTAGLGSAPAPVAPARFLDDGQAGGGLGGGTAGGRVRVGMRDAIAGAGRQKGAQIRGCGRRRRRRRQSRRIAGGVEDEGYGEENGYEKGSRQQAAAPAAAIMVRRHCGVPSRRAWARAPAPVWTAPAGRRQRTAGGAGASVPVARALMSGVISTGTSVLALRGL